MKQHLVLPLLKSVSIIVGIVAVIVLVVLLTLHVGTALSEHFRAFLSEPFPPMTVGQALCTLVVLAILLSFRR